MRKIFVNILLTFDKHIVEFIKIPKSRNFKINEKYFKELFLISKEAKKRKIDLAIIGSWALVILSKRNFKNISDIDLICKDKYLKNLKILLCDLGYREEDPKWPHTYRFSKDSIEVEFHDSKHMFFKIPLETNTLSYMQKDFTIVSPKALYRMYVKLFFRRKRNIKADLIKLKMLKNSQYWI
jgi:hypothetical protein